MRQNVSWSARVGVGQVGGWPAHADARSGQPTQSASSASVDSVTSWTRPQLSTWLGTLGTPGSAESQHDFGKCPRVVANVDNSPPATTGPLTCSFAGFGWSQTWSGGRVGLYAGSCDRVRRGNPAARRPAAIHLGLPSPAGSSGLPAGSGGQPSSACAGRQLPAAPLDLAPGGVYQAVRVTPAAGGLLHHRFTLTAAANHGGGLFSVALSRGSPRVAVNNHPALWSPDVPRTRSPAYAAARPARPP